MNAFFESMSGLTTTGATVIKDLDNTSKSILLWRAMLQWLGGIGIIVIAIAIFPILKIGGMQLFKLNLVPRRRKYYQGPHNSRSYWINLFFTNNNVLILFVFKRLRYL